MVKLFDYSNMVLRKESPMDQPILLTKAAFDSLLANLLEIEERMGEIFDAFFIELSEETEKLRELLRESVSRIDIMLPNITVVTSSDNEFPCVVVGSQVTVEDVCSGKVGSYQLVSPLKKSIGFHEVSFLSPMGKALLLKKVNEHIIVQAPGGLYEYKVLSIKIIADCVNNGD